MSGGLLPSAHILEIGAGTGWQAKALAELGHRVTAIDLPSSNYRLQRIWQVEEYDGINIPHADQTFDVVFSSNTLEHVRCLPELLAEIRRVLKDSGVAIHILPTTAWRMYSSLAHYVFIGRLIRRRQMDYERESNGRIQRGSVYESLTARLWRNLLPPVHGARGNIFSEHYYFSEYWWKRTFRENSYRVIQVRPGHLWYTGASLVGHRLGLQTRRQLSYFFGSACKVYQLKKVDYEQHP